MGEKNELFGEKNAQKAKGMNEFIEIETGLVLTSIGYKAESVCEIEEFWDESKHVVENKKGKITENGVESIAAVEKLEKLLNDKEVKFVDKNGWHNIDCYEKSEGEKYGKVREKMINIDQMIKVANGFDADCVW